MRPGAITDAYTYLEPLQPLTPAPYAQALPGLHTVQNSTSANVVGGYSWNSVGQNTLGASIGGGGNETDANSMFGDYGTVGGGSYTAGGGFWKGGEQVFKFYVYLPIIVKHNQ